jgi:hypothetical protein
MWVSSDRWHKIQGITEFAANLTIVVAVVVGVTLWLRSPKETLSLNQINLTGSSMENTAVGMKIDLPGIVWSSHRSTLVVAISSTCHYCLESAPFYSSITRTNHAAPIVVVMPQEQREAKTFLLEHAIAPSSTVSLPLNKIQVEGTPTLLLVSSSGTVIRSWVGELSKRQQQQVLESLDLT